MHGRKEKKSSVRGTETLFILRKEAQLERIESKYKDWLCSQSPPTHSVNFMDRREKLKGVWWRYNKTRPQTTRRSTNIFNYVNSPLQSSMILPAYWLVAVIRIWEFHPDSSPFEPLCIQIIFHKIRFVKGKCASFTEHLNCKLSYFHIEEAEPKPKTKTETYFFICPALLYKKFSRNKI